MIGLTMSVAIVVGVVWGVGAFVITRDVLELRGRHRTRLARRHERG
jgi:hypothetical protein